MNAVQINGDEGYIANGLILSSDGYQITGEKVY